jgi:hypothetical protein
MKSGKFIHDHFCVYRTAILVRDKQILWHLQKVTVVMIGRSDLRVIVFEHIGVIGKTCPLSEISTRRNLIHSSVKITDKVLVTFFQYFVLNLQIDFSLSSWI